MSDNKLQLDCLEICAGSVRSAIHAYLGGAQRIEFCTNLENGGTTPSHGQIIQVLERTAIDVFVLIRPRSGHFVYNDTELETMIQDIYHYKSLGIQGIVTGALKTDDTIDIKQCDQLKRASEPLPIVFHRAIDEIKDHLRGIDQLIDLGFTRVLTSGGAKTAFEGRKNIREMVMYAQDKIEIIAGSGINYDNIIELLRSTGVRQIHTSASEVSKAEAPQSRGLFWG